MAKVEVVRVYEDPGRSGGSGGSGGSGREFRVLVDRLWPRGVKKEALDLDEWAKDVAPSTDLRRWYGHRPERFEEFSDRYRAELREGTGASALQSLRKEMSRRRLVLLTATKDVSHSGAEVLREVLASG